MRGVAAAARAAAGALLACALLGVASPSPSPSASPAPAASPSDAKSAAIQLAQNRLDTMLRTGHADASWFGDAFLQQVSVSKVDEVLASIAKQLGPYQSIEYTPTGFIAHFAKGTDVFLIHLDDDNKIDGLFAKPPQLAASSLDDALRGLRDLNGTLSYVITEGRSERAALDPSEGLAVGSAFKLAVLNALLDEIARGIRHWTDVVPLQSRWKSLPSGVLQTWPDATPITIATYAAQMISISDNTAADTLVRLTGPRALASYAGSNDPFLTTRETFVLRSTANGDVRAAYLAAHTPSARAAVLRRVDPLPLPSLLQLGSTPLLAIEWHYSVRRLCTLMERVADLPLMQINPGVAQPGDFRRAAYKGGSDTGIINMTTMVTTHRGTKVCFSATLNNVQRDVSDDAFTLAYGTVLHQLASL
jgi:beta-lactamase class A